MESILFKGLSKKEYETVLQVSQITERDYNKGSYLFERLDAPEYMYILQYGGVQLEKIDHNGKIIIMDIFKKPGTIFGEVYLYLNDKLYDYSCVAVEDTKVLCISKSFFSTGSIDKEIQNKILHNMLEILSQKAFHLNQKILLLGSYSLRQKIAHYLLQRSYKTKEVYLDFNREELASYMGTTRPSISRELSQMEKDGVIVLEKDSITIIDREYLINIL